MAPQKQRILALVAIVVVLAGFTAGAVYAYLSNTTKPVENTFSTAPGHSISISEHFKDSIIKENVCVDLNDPGYAVYVRVAVVVTWQTESGEIHWKMPVASDSVSGDVGDYYMTVTDEWFLKDGYYYLKKPVYGEQTPILFQRCFQKAEAPDEGYKLHVEIIAQTIQAKGETDDGNIPAVQAAWGVYVDPKDDSLSPTAPVTS